MSGYGSKTKLMFTSHDLKLENEKNKQPIKNNQKRGLEHTCILCQSQREWSCVGFEVRCCQNQHLCSLFNLIIGPVRNPIWRISPREKDAAANF